MPKYLRALYDSAGDPNSNTPPFRKGDLLRFEKTHASGWMEIITADQVRGYISPAWVEEVADAEPPEPRVASPPLPPPPSQNEEKTSDTPSTQETLESSEPEAEHVPLKRQGTDWGNLIPESRKVVPTEQTIEQPKPTRAPPVPNKPKKAPPPVTKRPSVAKRPSSIPVELQQKLEHVVIRSPGKSGAPPRPPVRRSSSVNSPMQIDDHDDKNFGFHSLTEVQDESSNSISETPNSTTADVSPRISPVPPPPPNKSKPALKLSDSLSSEVDVDSTVVAPIPVIQETDHDNPNSDSEILSGYFDRKMLIENGKDAKNRSWKKFFVQLTKTQIEFYASEKDVKKAKKQSVLELHNKNVKEATMYNKRDYCFDVGNDNTCVRLQAPDIVAMKEWIEALEDRCGGAPLSPQVSSRSSPKMSRASRAFRKSTIKEDKDKDKDPTIKGRLNRFFMSRPKKQDLVSQGIIEDPVFGGTIENQVSKETDIAERPLVPIVITRCIAYLDQHLQEQGIYRVPGNTSHIQTLVADANKDIASLSLDEVNDVNTVAGFLKLYFRELSDPAFSNEHYSEFINAGREEDAAKRAQRLQELTKLLSPEKRATLLCLFEHLNRVAEQGAVNKMHKNNLAIVFGPTLLRGTDQNLEAIVMDSPYQTSVVEEFFDNLSWLQ